MMQRRARFRRLAGAAAIGAALLIAYASLRPPTDGGIAIPHIDKLQHLVAYGVLSAFACLAVAGRGPKLLAGLILYGGCLEIAQGLMPHERQPSLADALANAAGVLAGAAIAGLLAGRRFTRRP